MPTYTGASIADEARNVHLNRAGVSDLAILPIINSEYEQLQQKLIENGVPIFKKTFDVISVSPNAVSITPITDPPLAGQLPTDFVEPIMLYEKSNGAADTEYTKMKERRFLPIVEKGDRLIYWSWDEEEIKLVGATAIRDVRIIGYKSLPLLVTLQGLVRISFSKGYLAAAVASRAALTISHNPNLASNLKDLAEEKLEELLAKHTRKNQSLSIRRRAYRRPGG